MKLITTIYSGRDLELNVTIQPRSQRDTEGRRVEVENMLQTRQSKVGNTYLIFAPTLYLSLRNRDWNGGARQEATILAHQVYRFNALLTQVYNNAMGKGVYREDNGLFLDQKATAAAARRMSLYHSSLTLFPDIMAGPDNTQLKAIGFQVDKQKIGAMSLLDTMAMIDVLDHLDLTTYTLAAGLLEEMGNLQTLGEVILNRLDGIEGLLRQLGQPPTQSEAPQRNSTKDSVFSWESRDANYGMRREVMPS